MPKDLPPHLRAELLIIDDTPHNLRLLNHILSEEFLVRAATSGEGGLEAARTNPPDLILLDVLMPGIDGYETAGRLKAEEPTRDIPIIFISGLDDIESKVRGFNAGAVDFISKPFQAQEVLARVRTHLSLRALTRQLQSELAERQRAEAEIRRMNAELEQRVSERTMELELALKELESISYTVSHDLRTPLRAILGYAGIIEAEQAAGLPPEVLPLLNLIRQNAHLMGAMVDGLLNFMRLNRKTLSLRSVDSAGLVQRAWAALGRETQGRQVEFIVHDLPSCRADIEMLYDLWSHLLSNALKFSRPRAIARVEVGCQPGEKASPVYYVKDNGVGFDLQYANQLFKAFHRLHRPDEFEGLGLGLALAQRVVFRHGGRIWAEAREGQGANFYFTLGESGDKYINWEV